MPGDAQEPQSRHEEVTRLIQEGRRPDDLRGRAELMRDKVTGRVPLGVDAPNKFARKTIGGAGKLLVVLRYGFIGLFALLMGALFLWAGLSQPYNFKTAAIGAAVAALGVFALRRAWSAWGVLKAISRA